MRTIEERNFFSNLIIKVCNAIHRHGYFGLIGVIAKHLTNVFMISLRPSIRAEIKARKFRCRKFDKQYGVNTSGFIHHTDLKVINNQNKIHAAAYFGTDPKYFNDIIGNLAIDYKQFKFIDFGSGMGRVVMLATLFPFKRIIGVEFSDELHYIAEDNID